MDLTTLSSVKALLSESTSDNDTILGDLISGVSRRIEQEMRREDRVELKERTEVYPLGVGRSVVSLRAAPVALVDSRGSSTPLEVRVSATQSFVGIPALVKNQDYVLEASVGLLRIYSSADPLLDRSTGRPLGPVYVSVRYVGGLAADAAGIKSSYPDLATAAALQVANLFKRRSELSGGDVRVGDSTATHSEDYALLADVREVVGRYTRRSY